MTATQDELKSMITSRDNPQIKELKKLQQKRFRVRRGQFAAEGEDLVAAALAAGWEPESLFCTPDAPADLLNHPKAVEVEFELLAGASALGSGARVIGQFALPADDYSSAPPANLSLFLHGVADPGNIGTLLRGADAFADGPVLVGEGCADAYSPKALRAAMGATFAKPPMHVDGPASDAYVVALDGDGDVDIREVEPRANTVLCAGGERDGLSESLLLSANVVARIPMREGGPESLNVAMATTIALYELSAKLQTGVHGDAGQSTIGGNVPLDEK